MNQDWSAMADATIRILKEAGWPILAGAGLLTLAWKWLDSWGKKPK